MATITYSKKGGMVLTRKEISKLGGLKTAKIRKSNYYLHPNRCLYCKKILPYDCYTSKRKFCNHSCSIVFYKGGNMREKLRYCKECAALLLNTQKGVYCSQRCGINFLYKCFIKKWLNHEVSGYIKGGGVSKRIRRYLFEVNNSQCQNCGWSTVHMITQKVPLAIDHIDGNYRNCYKENLQLLCFNCHTLTPTFGSLNKGRGRKKKIIFIEDMGA